MRDNLLAVSYDAGGAEVLSSYLRHRRGEYGVIRCVVDGPAKKIFLGKGLKRSVVGINTGRNLISNRKIDLLLTSVSWSSGLEVDFIKSAKERSIKTVVMLEHWVNYKGRFRYPHKGWRMNLPDEIWVVDKLAKKIAEKEFGDTVKISIKPNFYFRDLKSEYRKINTENNKRYFKVLFLSEAITEYKTLVKKKIKVTDAERVARLIEFMKGVDCSKPIIFKIRPHPVESPSKYSSVIKNSADIPGYRIILSDTDKNPLLRDIKSADAVIGIRSPALIAASLFGKKSICWYDRFPPWFSAYNIKHAGSSFKKLRRLLFERR